MKLLLTTTILAVGLMAQPCAKALVFSFDTSTSALGWTATAGGATDVMPFLVSGFGNAGGRNVLSVTSSGNSAGAFLAGGSLANFDGFWTARYTFTLPADAFNMQLNYSNLFHDDRGLLLLNGIVIGSSAAVPPGGSLNGFMVSTPGGPSQPYTFAGPFGTVNGTVIGALVPGLNTIDVIVNNTGNGPGGALNTLAPNDGTAFSLSGTVTYSVPEPSIGAFGILFLGGMVLRRIRGKK